MNANLGKNWGDMSLRESGIVLTRRQVSSDYRFSVTAVNWPASSHFLIYYPHQVLSLPSGRGWRGILFILSGEIREKKVETHWKADLVSSNVHRKKFNLKIILSSPVCIKHLASIIPTWLVHSWLHVVVPHGWSGEIIEIWHPNSRDPKCWLICFPYCADSLRRSDRKRQHGVSG